MAREPASVTVYLYASLADFSERRGAVSFVAGSRHQAAKYAIYAVFGLGDPMVVPPGVWVAAVCRADSGGWEKWMVGEVV